ncbi:MAG: methyl-accepting chemotaxis protein [Thermoplasmata archaeon]
MDLFGNERKRLRKKLKNTRDRLKNKEKHLEECRRKKQAWKDDLDEVFEAGIFPMMIVDEEGSVERINPAAENSLTSAGEDLKEENFGNIFEGDSDLITDCITEGKEILEREGCVRSDEETEKYFSISFVPLESGDSSRALVLLKDITEKKELEERLEEVKNENETLIENAPISISITDLEDDVLFANEYMADKFGYPKEELEGKNFSELMSEEQFEKLRRKTENRKEGGTESYELKFQKQDGSEFEAIVSGAPYKNTEGEVVKTVGYIQDITPMKELQREQKRAKEYLEDQVMKILGALERFEEGDMSIRIEKEKDDDIGKLIDGINKMMNRLRNNLQKIKDASIELNNASETIASSSEELNAVSENVSKSVEDMSEDTNLQARKLENLSEIIENSAANMEETSASAENITSAAEEARAQTESGKKNAVEADNTVDELKSILKSTKKNVENLEAKSQKIGEVVDTISDIADQTNLLALNAAIEAARAGKQGEGFAVVADSVRELAEDTQQETDHIKEMIEETQENTSKVVESVEGLAEKIEDVDEITHENLDSLEEIEGSVDSVSTSIMEISRAVEEVTEHLQESSNMVHSITEIANRNSEQAESVAASTEEQNASIEELSSSAQNLAGLANNLLQVVEEYDLD